MTNGAALREALPPLDTDGVLWVAAIDRVPIEERVAWVKDMAERVAQINTKRQEHGLRPSPDRVLDAARRYAAEGRESHVLWAAHLKAHRNGDACASCTAEVVATAGDLDAQLEWVRKYDVILTALDFVDETLAVRLVDVIAKISNEEERKQRVRNAQHALRYRAESRSANG